MVGLAPNMYWLNNAHMPTSRVSTQQLTKHAENLEVINTEISASLARQSASGDRIDSKSVFLVGYAGAASSFLATRHLQQPLLAGLAFAAFAAAAVLGILAYAVRLHLDVPEPRVLLTKYVTESRTQTLAALAASRVMAFEANSAGHRAKRALWWLSLCSIATGMVLMILSLIRIY